MNNNDIKRNSIASMPIAETNIQSTKMQHFERIEVYIELIILVSQANIRCPIIPIRDCSSISSVELCFITVKYDMDVKHRFLKSKAIIDSSQIWGRYCVDQSYHVLDICLGTCRKCDI